MTQITMPDFYKWAIKVTGLHCVYRLVGTQDALKQAFDQGYALGFREGELKGQKDSLTNTQEWWEPQDSDKEWLAAHDEPTTEE